MNFTLVILFDCRHIRYGNEGFFNSPWLGMFGKSVNEPAHFIFFDPEEPRENHGRRWLRIRRLESLVAYLMLIRGFYSNLLDKVLPKPEDGRSMHLKRVKCDIDFKGTARRQGFFLDRVSGTIFTIGTEAHISYIGLQIAFLKSIWHIAEVMKLCSIACIASADENLKKENPDVDDCVFMPNEPFGLDMLTHLSP